MTLPKPGNPRELLALVCLVGMVALYFGTHPSGPTTYVMTIWANQATILALVAIAQFFAVLVRGLDLSVGAIVALSNVVASHLLSGSAFEIAYGTLAVLVVATICGLVNGLLIVFGRLQPIVATLATSAVFGGIALLLRPTPGGAVDYDYADAMTLDVAGVPTALILMLVIVLGFWLPLRRTGFGLSLYAIGSAGQAAWQSGTPVAGVRIGAFVLAGFFAGLAGLFVSFVTTTGDAGIAPTYTLNSIAAIVLGGVALRGGVGSLFGAIIGAFILKTIAALMFFSGLPPLAQPFVEGLILALAIAIGSVDVLRMRHRLEVFDR